jgi:hypothetical protein
VISAREALVQAHLGGMRGGLHITGRAPTHAAYSDGGGAPSTSIGERISGQAHHGRLWCACPARAGLLPPSTSINIVRRYAPQAEEDQA